MLSPEVHTPLYSLLFECIRIHSLTLNMPPPRHILNFPTSKVKEFSMSLWRIMLRQLLKERWGGLKTSSSTLTVAVNIVPRLLIPNPQFAPTVGFPRDFFNLLLVLNMSETQLPAVFYGGWATNTDDLFDWFIQDHRFGDCPCTLEEFKEEWKSPLFRTIFPKRYFSQLVDKQTEDPDDSKQVKRTLGYLRYKDNPEQTHLLITIISFRAPANKPPDPEIVRKKFPCVDEYENTLKEKGWPLDKSQGFRFYASHMDGLGFMMVGHVTLLE
ncbi:hypothetical protein ABKN59_011709 [Abortiporus biennis]